MKKAQGTSLESALLARVKKMGIEDRTRILAEQLRDEAVRALLDSGCDSEEKQRLARSIRVIPGARYGQWLVRAPGEYGRKLEFGCKNSPESPWFIPSFVTLSRSIITVFSETRFSSKARQFRGGR